jgi:hypothetical protein
MTIKIETLPSDLSLVGGLDGLADRVRGCPKNPSTPLIRFTVFNASYLAELLLAPYWIIPA